MTSRKRVTPNNIRANGTVGNPFTGNKKWEITCGNCQHTWQAKVPMIETSSALCPCCGAQNLWDAHKFLRHLHREMERQA